MTRRPRPRGRGPNPRPFSDLTREIDRDPERRARVERAKQDMRAELLDYSLGDLRRAMDVTQVELADRLAITQPSLSGIENRADQRMSTVRGIVEGLGGRLEVTAVFGDERYELSVGVPPEEGPPTATAG